MNENVRHLCIEAGMGRMSIDKVEACGICTVQDLVDIGQRIDRGELILLWGDGTSRCKYNQLVLRKLLVISEWASKHPNANIMKEFDEDVYYAVYNSMGFE